MMPNECSPHVVIFPLPLQGPVNCMLKLGELLCLDHIKVTFINTDHIQRRLFDCTTTQAYFTSNYPDSFQFQTIPDGLPQDNPRTAFEFSEMMASLEATAQPILLEMVTSGAYSGIVADGLLGFAADVAARIALPLLFFDTISPCALWTYMCLPQLIQAGEIPFKDDNLDEMITNTSGMEGILRRRDLPHFCRAIDFNDLQVKLVLREVDNIPLARGLILNSCEQVDAPILAQMLNVCTNVYALGPLHTHLQTRLAAERGHDQPLNSSSLWKEDSSCISWLDKQPSKSVVYVSIGSLSTMTKDEYLEILHGLVNSGARFLWVRRPGSVIGLEESEIPVELLRCTEERGHIVRWAPQQEVLAHRAVGGFLTHSGWNSTLESIVAGKPMICWPHYVDQQVNSRYVGEVWKIGLDMKDSCDRVVVEKMVREVMELRKDEFFNRAQELSKLAKSSVGKGGSSSADLDRLIKDIKMMKILPTKQS